MQVIKDELKQIKEKYGDERRTEIIAETEEFSIEDMIAEEDMVITITHSGYIKRFPVSGYRRQKRGGVGVIGADTKETDSLEHLFVASTHHHILFFTDRGKCYWLKVHEIPQAGRGSRGRAIINLIAVEKGENVKAVVPVKSFDDQHFVFMATRQGQVKKTNLDAFSNPRKTGINAIKINTDDELIDAKLTDGTNDIILGTYKGKAIRFKESNVRPMGRTAAGVRGISLDKDDRVVGMVVVRREGTLLVVTDLGYGKRSNISDYRVTSRGGKGIITLHTTDRVGNMIAMMEVLDEEDLLIISEKGKVIRQNISKIKVIGRNTQGVRLISLNDGDSVADVARVVREEEAKEEDSKEEESNEEE